MIRVTPRGESFIVEAPGLARSLGSRDALTMLRSVPDEEKGYALARTPGGEQEIWHVTEAGFYRVLGQRQAARIKDPKVRSMVERFQSWVFGVVLPSGEPTEAAATPEPAAAAETPSAESQEG